MALRIKGKAPAAGEPDRRYYMIDIQEAGRRVRLSSGTRNRAIAEKREQAVLDALRLDATVSHADLQTLVRGAPRAATAALLRTSGAITLKQACDAALSDREPWAKMKRGWAEAPSRDTYVSRCIKLQEYLGAHTPLSQIDGEKLKELNAKVIADGRSTTTANRNIFALLSVMRRAKERGDFTGEIPRFTPHDESGKSRMFVFTMAQEQELFNAILALDEKPMTEAGGCPRKRDAHDYHDLFVFLMDVGCRLSAGLNVRWSDIFEDNGHTFVRFWRQEEQKGGRTRTTPLTARVARMIAARRTRRGPGPFSGLTRRRAAHIWNQAKAETSLAHEKDAVTHALRHTCATRLLQATGDIKLVQEWLGHSALQTTEAVYAKVLTDHKLEAMRAFESRWTSPDIPTGGTSRDRNLPATGSTSPVRH